MYNPTIAEVMSIDPIVISPNDTVDKVDQLFKEHSFHHLPVVNDQKQVVGIISKSDYFLLCDHMTLFLKEKERKNNLAFFRSLLVEEVMTHPVATLNGSAKVSVAVGYFRENLFHAVPVVNGQGQLIGIITTMDVINYAYNEFNLLDLPKSNIEQLNKY